MCSFAAVKKLLFLLMVLMCGWVPSLHAQLLDDSTQLVYGPKTTLWFSESGILDNNYDTVRIDTALNELEKFAFIDQLQQQYQDLGNIGTAMYPLFYQAPEVSGIRSGYEAYDPIVHSPERMQYFDSKSPFINLKVVLGGQGRNVIDVLYTQNVNSDWSIGFEINRLNIDKQLGAQITVGDRNLESTQMNLFTQYQHPEKPYKLVAYLNQFNHNVQEIGGIYYTDSSSNTEIYQYLNSTILLTDATLKEKRKTLHLMHAYGFFKQFQLYHRLTLENQKISYSDFTDGSSGTIDTYSDFYPNFFIDEDSTYQQLDFGVLQNEIGLKGDIESVYYRFYAKHRRIKQRWLYLGEQPIVNEVYIGGLSRFTWKDIISVEAMGELMQTGDYLLKANLNSDLLKVNYKSQLYQPASIQRRYFGNHYEWDNTFSSTFVNELEGVIQLDTKAIDIRPNARFTTLSNYIYFDTLSQPSQYSDALLLSRFGVDLAFEIPTDSEKGYGFQFENKVFFTEVTGNDESVYPVPKWFVNSRWYWQGNWFKDDVPVQIGFNFHARSGYFGRGYSPSIQQYHTQNHDLLDGYFTVDPFVSMKVNHVFVFFKVTHANQLPEDGYFITPNYLGQGRVFDFGVRWLFFD